MGPRTTSTTYTARLMTSDNAKTVYVETSVVSYLTARATSNLLAAAWQTATAEWWDAHRPRFELRTSALTIEEAGRGHREAAARRLEALDGIAMLPITEAAVTLAEALIDRRALPTSALNDAIHIAVSAVCRRANRSSSPFCVVPDSRRMIKCAA